MRKLTVVLVVLIVAASVAGAQTFDEYEQSIQTFATEVANSLPLNASVGLNWSDAYIGQFPHFGVGLALGFSTVPYPAVRPVLDALGLAANIEANEQFKYIEQYGAPFPAYAVEARLGGFVLPFDVGVKLGTVPPNVDTSALVPGLNFSYLLAGADVRVNLLDGTGILPKLSVGGGYNYLDASIGLQGIAGGNIEITSFEDPRPGYEGTFYDFTLTDPEVSYFWQANVFDFTVQASKSLLLFTPYVGAGASIGFGKAGGGLSSDLTSTPTLSDADIEDINDLLAQGGYDTLPQLGSQGFSVTADMPTGWAFRAFGGVSVNLLILKIDVTGMYDFIGKNFGLTLGTRVQF